MSPALKTALILLAITVGLIAIGWMCNHYLREVIMRFEPGELRAPLDGFPRMNEGGGWEQADGRITRDVDGLEPIRTTIKMRLPSTSWRDSDA